MAEANALGMNANSTRDAISLAQLQEIMARNNAQNLKQVNAIARGVGSGICRMNFDIYIYAYKILLKN